MTPRFSPAEESHVPAMPSLLEHPRARFVGERSLACAIRLERYRSVTSLAVRMIHPKIARRDVPKKHWTTTTGQAAGHPAAFVIVVIYAMAWLIFDRATFDWNAIATLAVFVMTLFIQRANRRDNLALHAKLDELLRVNHAARSELTQLDEQEPEVIERHRDEEVRKSNAA
jgi:low affinity Fe/Cu permease